MVHTVQLLSPSKLLSVAKQPSEGFRCAAPILAMDAFGVSWVIFITAVLVLGSKGACMGEADQ